MVDMVDGIVSDVNDIEAANIRHRCKEYAADSIRKCNHVLVIRLLTY